MIPQGWPFSSLHALWLMMTYIPIDLNVILNFSLQHSKVLILIGQLSSCYLHLDVSHIVSRKEL